MKPVLKSAIDTAMIFAAGRGARMRPLTDHTPKPLLSVQGKPLIVWQIEALARAGIRRIVINHAWLGSQIEAALGDGSRWQVDIVYSPEGDQALETAGGIAHALPLITAGHRPGNAAVQNDAAHPVDQGGTATTTPPPAPTTIFLAVSGDIVSDFDYTTLQARAAAMRDRAVPSMHLVMVPNPPFHPNGDFALDGERLALDGPQRVTFANIGLYDSRMFAALAAQTPPPCLPLGPIFREAITAGVASGELWTGRWENVGTPEQLGALSALDARQR